MVREFDPRQVPRIVVIGLLLWTAVPASSGPDSGPAQAARAPRVHADRGAAERELGGVVRAVIRDDLASTRAAMDRLKLTVRELVPEEGDALGRDVVVYSQAFHAAMNRARETAGAGEALRVLDDLYRVIRTCRQCHDSAVLHGVAVFDEGGKPAEAAPAPPSP